MSLIDAVQEGRMKEVQKIIQNVDLSHSRAWSQGYVLLCEALKDRQTEVAKLLINKNCKLRNRTGKPDDTPLHLAVSIGSLEIVELLLNKYADINLKNKSGATPLYVSVRKENIEITKCLLTHGACINIDAQGCTPLHAACTHRSTTIAEHLLNHGANASLADYKSLTPLHTVSERNDVTMVELLLKHHADANVATKNNETPLHVACKTRTEVDNAIVIVNHLLNNGANINFKTCNGRTPLHLALESGNMKIFDLLLKHHPDVNVAAEKNETPLHVACKKGYTTAAEHLLNHGANVNFVNHESYAPLHLAVANGQDEIISLLLNKGADVNAVTMNGSTPLLIAISDNAYHCHYFNTSKCAELLLEHGAHVNVKNKDGQTSLYFSIKNKDKKLISRFLTHDLDINLNTPAFIYAIQECDDTNIVHDLKEHGFTIDIENSKSAKLLSSVIHRGHVSVFKDLLEFGIDVNSLFGGEEYSLLHEAAKYGQEEITDLLIQNGANVNAKDNLGISPIFYAISGYNAFITKILLSNGAHVLERHCALHRAAKAGCKGSIEELLKYNANINGLSKTGTTALFWAVSTGHEECVKTLIKHGADVNVTLKGNNLLHTAAANRNACVLKLLLKYISFVNNKSREDMTPLIIAVKYKHLDNVCILLDHDADVNVQMYNGLTALHFAVKTAEVEIVEELLKYNANLNSSYPTRSPNDLALEQKEYYEQQLYLSDENFLHRSDSYKEYYEYQSNSDEEFDGYSYGGRKTCSLSLISNKYHDLETICCLLETQEVKLEIMYSDSDMGQNEEDPSLEDIIDYCRLTEDNLFYHKCRNDINKMKRTSVNNNVSYYDILTGTKRKLLIYTRNDNILNVFESKKYKELFPMYGDFLEMNIKNGIKRNNLLKEGKKILYYFFKAEIPDLVTEEILSYLSNFDLKKLQHIINFMD